MILKNTFAGLVLSVPMAAQGLVVLEGATPTSLTVTILDESQLASGIGTTLLQGVEVLPIEITGRRASQDLDGTTARIDTRNGVQRVELPGIGRILAYRRQAGTMFGYLFVPLLGGARVLVELPGTGPAGTTSPFLDRIGVAKNGAYAVLPAGGGVLHIVRLDGGTMANGLTSRTVTIPVGIDNTGLMVGSSVAFATAGDHIYRFQLAAGGATDLTPSVPLTNPRLKPELAMSGDGNTVAFLYGDSNTTLQIFLLDASSGAPVQLPPPAGKYEEPGYLPEATGDLRLMLNNDGSRLFYIENGLPGSGHGGDESYLLDTTGVLPTLQVTSDAHFQPYIGIHILPAFKGTTLVAAIGDVNLMDWFKADLTTTGGTISNITGTGGQVQPFPAGALIPTKIKLVGATAFATDTTTNAQTLRALNVDAASSQVVAQNLGADLAVGSALATQPDLYVPGVGDSIFSGLTGNLIGTAPPGITVSPPLSTPFFGVTGVHLGPTWSQVTFYAATGGVFFGPLIQNLDQMVLTPGGGMLISSPTELLYLSLGRPILLVPNAHQGVRVFLTGANG